MQMPSLRDTISKSRENSISRGLLTSRVNRTNIKGSFMEKDRSSLLESNSVVYQ